MQQRKTTENLAIAGKKKRNNMLFSVRDTTTITTLVMHQYTNPEHTIIKKTRAQSLTQAVSAYRMNRPKKMCTCEWDRERYIENIRTRIYSCIKCAVYALLYTERGNEMR